jgi:hypothetical protein
LSLPKNNQTGFGTQTAVLLVMGLKMLGREVHHPPPSSDEFKNAGAVFLLSRMPLWCAPGQLYLKNKFSEL